MVILKRNSSIKLLKAINYHLMSPNRRITKPLSSAGFKFSAEPKQSSLTTLYSINKKILSRLIYDPNRLFKDILIL